MTDTHHLDRRTLFAGATRAARGQPKVEGLAGCTAGFVCFLDEMAGIN